MPPSLGGIPARPPRQAHFGIQSIDPVHLLSTLQTPRYHDACKTRCWSVCWTLTRPDFHRQVGTSFPNALPHVLVSTGTATLIITGRAPRQLPLRALSTKQKHPITAATWPAYRAVSSPCRPPGHEASIATQRPYCISSAGLSGLSADRSTTRLSALEVTGGSSPACDGQLVHHRLEVRGQLRHCAIMTSVAVSPVALP